MRRRETLNIWPAIADLMTILAVPTLFVSIGLFPYWQGSSPDPGARFDPRGFELPRNESMFRAIQQAESFVQEVHVASRLKLDADQSLRFGDRMVRFDRNGYRLQWRENGPQVLHQFCLALSDTLQKRPKMRGRFVIVIEGHADASTCHGSSDCNWTKSSERAANFLIAMQNEKKICPGASKWVLQPTGFAATHPLSLRQSPSSPLQDPDDQDRRIALRLLPDYKKIIEDVRAELAHPR